MFQPEEIIFAPTGRCNLRCPHCRVARGPAELSSADAVAFLDACAESGVERIGFSGGEPFLRPDFLVEVSRAAVERGLFFDRLMTNGDWWKDEEGLRSSLAAVCEAGFDGIVGLSYDAYHGQRPERVAAFLRAVFEAWGRKDAAEILSVRSPDDGAFLAGLDEVAKALGGRVESSDGEPARVVDAAYLARSESDPDDGSGLLVPVVRSPLSRSAGEGAWDASRWFADDYCAGPGNVLYVHPDGSVAVCCGFANENPELIVGTARDSYDALMRNAAERPLIRACYETGLGETRKRLEASGVKFPGKTGDACFFCDYLCRRGFDLG
ncbi:MAG: radical SAM protein [Spirochaetes bacterium]|nr:radical SAM protein [Spirochaetota bacterium]MBU1079245.1 radical SAM protein [Spirochaetota bacterium]